MNSRFESGVTVVVYATATLVAADTFVTYPAIRVDLAVLYGLALLMPLYAARNVPLSHANVAGILLLAAVWTIRAALRI